jgi:uncharacterized protein (DUF2237 family)
MQKDEAISVLGEPLVACGENPVTGFFRDAYCNTCKEDVGSHTVCIETSREFLEYSRSKGNDLSTPMPEYGFEGLRPGDTWCLCAARWLQAYHDDMAPRIYLRRTHQRALDTVPMELLKQFAMDIN